MALAIAVSCWLCLPTASAEAYSESPPNEPTWFRETTAYAGTLLYSGVPDCSWRQGETDQWHIENGWPPEYAYKAECVRFYPQADWPTAEATWVKCRGEYRLRTGPKLQSWERDIPLIWEYKCTVAQMPVAAGETESNEYEYGDVVDCSRRESATYEIVWGGEPEYRERADTGWVAHNGFFDCGSLLARIAASKTAPPLPTPDSEEPPTGSPGDVGVNCGEAGFDWYDIAKQKSFVNKGESACYFLFSSRTANEVLAHLHEHANLSDALGSAIMLGLKNYGPDIAKWGAKKGAQIWIKQYERKLAIRLWGWLSKAGPRAVALMTRMNTIFTLGTVAGVAAVPISAVWVLNAIRNKDACIGIKADVDGGKLKIDWSLVYDYGSVDNPAKNPSLWNATVFDRKERSFRSDELVPKYLGLRCTNGGTVRRGPSDPDVFSRTVGGVFSGS